jgi:NADH-quinone oxidoreductase subunit N
VAQAGYILVGLLGNDTEAMASVLFYAATYAFTTLGAFAVVGWVEKQSGSDSLAAFAGLGKRAPFMSMCLLVFLLSLAGIPPLAGFFGKFYLFTAALHHESGDLRLVWLVLLAVGMSAVSLYYYLQVLKQVYVADAPENSKAMGVPMHLNLILFLLTATVVLLGCAPDLLLGRLLEALNTSF